MDEDQFLERPRTGSKTARAIPYTAKDFQLEVLSQLAETQALAESLREILNNDFRKRQEQSKLLRFDGRTLVAIGAIALSLTGYVLQDARNASKRDVEIETTKARLTNLETAVAANTEGRIRVEVELGELREGQSEIENMMPGRNGGRKTGGKK